jgi:CRP-like cAMP-binding protein
VDKDNYLLELSRYVHLNPVRAGIVERPEAYPYSSYKSFIQKEGEEIVYRDLILAMLASDPALARSKYRAFIESAISEELESPLKDVYGGAILGGENFIRKTLGRLKDETLSKEEVSSRRELQKSMGAEEILKIVSHHLGISIEDLAVQKDDKRDLTIYLLKKYTGLTNRRIGDLFGGLSYSAVAKVYARFPEKAEKDSALGKLLLCSPLQFPMSRADPTKVSDNECGHLAPLGAPSESCVHAAGPGHFVGHLGAAGDEEHLIPQAPFDGQVMEFFHVGLVNVVVSYYGGDQNNACARLLNGIQDPGKRNRSSQVVALEAVPFNASMLDVQNLSQSDECSSCPTVAPTTWMSLGRT